jgi:hypothetical protein
MWLAWASRIALSGVVNGHAFDTLDILGGEVGIVDDEPLRYLPPDAYGIRQRDVNTGRADVGQLVNR